MIKITCPECGAEYIPNEIYLPNEFIGKQSDVVKDSEGKILDTYGKDMDLNEIYICDYCNTRFSITAKLNFKTAKTKESSFSNYKTSLKKQSLFMKED